MYKLTASKIRCVLMVACLSIPGCYSADQLVEQAKQRIALNRTVEITIGSYQVTLPHSNEESEENVAKTVAIDLAATVSSREQASLEQQLADAGPRLRDAMIVTLRETDNSELLEPGLASLHKRVKNTVDEFITDGEIQRLSFRDFSVYED